MNGNTNNLIDKKIDDIINHNNLFHTGKVIKINNFIIEATGLEEVFYFEKVIIGDENNIGYVCPIFSEFEKKFLTKTGKYVILIKNNLQNADEKGENRMIVYSEVIKS